MKLAPDVEFDEDIRLLVYRPCGVLNEQSVDKIVRIMSYLDRPPVKSAILATDSTITHYCQLHAIITEDSPIKVRIFQELGGAAQWLGVSPQRLATKSSPTEDEAKLSNGGTSAIKQQ